MISVSLSKVSVFSNLKTLCFSFFLSSVGLSFFPFFRLSLSNRKMRKDVLVLFFAFACVACVCRGQTSEDGKYEIEEQDWPLNGVPFVSEDGDTYPTYEERATLVWGGVVCFPPFFMHTVWRSFYCSTAITLGK